MRRAMVNTSIISVRRNGHEVERIERIKFTGKTFRARLKCEDADGFVNYDGHVHAIYKDGASMLFLEMDRPPIRIPYPLTRVTRGEI